MPHVSSFWVRSSVMLAGAASFLLIGTGAASAHVKWFCAFDVAGQPRGLEQVLCTDFELLTGLALVCLMFGCLAEGTHLGTALLNALDRVTAAARVNSALIVRAVMGFFLVSLWNLGGIILTPELKTDVAWIPWLQLAMAAGLLWKRTLPFTAAGIVSLFGFAVWNYGIFHLADYPVFLGVAAFLALTAFDRTLFGQRPIDVVRIAAAITLMWASVEKWAYPHWTDPLIAAKPAMTMGASPELFMQAAGVIEFTLAFALIWTPLVRRASAIILTAVFVSAIFEFGKIDAIGHSGIIAVLIAIAADDARVPATRRDVVLAPVYYASALMLFLGAYYLAHSTLYGAGYGIGAGMGGIPVI
ncbi:Transmembrane protein [Methylorubrum aminovorans]